jgi:hypothetical protein
MDTGKYITIIDIGSLKKKHRKLEKLKDFLLFSSKFFQIGEIDQHFFTSGISKTSMIF